MTSSYDKQKKMHYDIMNVGLRAQATAVGLVQLCIELKKANVLDEASLDRIKGAIASELCVSTPRGTTTRNHRAEIDARLDRLFKGEETVGPADALAFGDTVEGDDTAAR